MRAVCWHIKKAWITGCIERWLKAPFIDTEGSKIERTSGTPRGWVIRVLFLPICSCIMRLIRGWCENTQASFERYVDDAIIHCRTEAEAAEILAKLRLNQRPKKYKLELRPTKTKIVYCKDRRREFPNK